MLKAETIVRAGISSGRPMFLRTFDSSRETIAEPTSEVPAVAPSPDAVKPPPNPSPSQRTFPHASFHQRRRTVDGSETSLFPAHHPLLPSPPLTKGHVAADGGLPGWRSPSDSAGDGLGSDGSPGSSPAGERSYETASDKGPSRGCGAFHVTGVHGGLKTSTKRGIGPFKRRGWQERTAASGDSLDSPPANGSSRGPGAQLAPWSPVAISSPLGHTRPSGQTGPSGQAKPPPGASPSSLLRPKPFETQPPHGERPAPWSESTQNKTADPQPPHSVDPALKPNSSSQPPAGDAHKRFSLQLPAKEAPNDAHRRSSFHFPADGAHIDAHKRFDRSRRWSLDGSDEASLRIKEEHVQSRDWRSPQAPRCVFGWAAQTRLQTRRTLQGSPQDSLPAPTRAVQGCQLRSPEQPSLGTAKTRLEQRLTTHESPQSSPLSSGASSKRQSYCGSSPMALQGPHGI